jgi:hypothetical protein
LIIAVSPVIHCPESDNESSGACLVALLASIAKLQKALRQASCNRGR